MGLFPSVGIRMFPSTRTLISLGSQSRKPIKSEVTSTTKTTATKVDGFLKALVNAFRLYV